MFDSFYDIKSEEEWLDPHNGMILNNKAAIAVYQIIPSSFGHAVVFPRKRNVYEATDMTEKGLYLFNEVVDEVPKRLRHTIKTNPGHIMSLYERWVADENLNSSLNGIPKARISKILNDLKEGRLDLEEPDFTIFINKGRKTGQTVRQHHVQIKPTYKKGRTGEILFRYEHGVLL